MSEYPTKIFNTHVLNQYVKFVYEVESVRKKSGVTARKIRN